MAVESNHKWPGFPAHPAGCALALTLLVGILTYQSIPVFAQPPGNNPTDPVIRQTASWPVWLWCVGSMLAVSARNRSPGTLPIRTEWIRTLYSAGCLALFLHMAVAFHMGHGWSHARAYRHVEEVSGLGSGLYVNYAFAAIWLADVAWAWIDLDHYIHRSRWLAWCLLLFMAFIVFNAAIVFGSGLRRLASAVLFILPLYALWTLRPQRTRNLKTNEPGHQPGSQGVLPSAVGHSPT